MYAPPMFKPDRAASLAFAETRGFGTACAWDGKRPIASALPFYLENFCSSLWWRGTSGLLRQVERTVDRFDQWRRGQGSEHHNGVTSLDVDGSGKPANAN